MNFVMTCLRISEVETVVCEVRYLRYSYIACHIQLRADSKTAALVTSSTRIYSTEFHWQSETGCLDAHVSFKVYSRLSRHVSPE